MNADNIGTAILEATSKENLEKEFDSFTDANLPSEIVCTSLTVAFNPQANSTTFYLAVTFKP